MEQSNATHRARSRRLREIAQVVALGLLWGEQSSCQVGYDVSGREAGSTEAGTQGDAGRPSAPGAAGRISTETSNVAAGGGSLAWTGPNLGGATAIPGDSAGGSFEQAGARARGGVGGIAGVTLASGVAGSGAGPNGVGGTVGTTSATSIVSCGMEIDNTGNRLKRKMLLRDDVTNRLAFIDIEDGSASWFIELTSSGRDLQLVGDCRVMVGTANGYDEYDLLTRRKVAEVNTFAGTVAAHRLRNRNTVLVGVGQGSSPYQGGDGVVLVEVDAAANVVNKVVVPGTYYVRLVRQTPTGTFLISNNTRAIEVDRTGIVQSTVFSVSTSGTTHVWKALRIATSIPDAYETVVSTGNQVSLAFFDDAGNLRRRITGGSASIADGAPAVNPQFYSDFQVLGSGNIVLANSYEVGQAHFTDCIPILEYTADGALAWVWGDPAYSDRLTSIKGVIVLDGLDPSKLHVEDTNGRQVPVD